MRMPGKLDVAADGVAVELRKKRVAELSNPNSEYFKASDAFLAQFVARAREEKRRKVERVEVPYKLMGEEIRKLEALFGVRVDVVPRRPTRTPMASATAWLAERRLEYAKAWDGEQVVWPDGDLTYTVVKFRNYWHVCRSGSSGAVAVDAARQDAVLRSLSLGRNSAVAAMAASALESIGGCKSTQTVCVDAVRCRVRCDTVFLNLAKVSVSPFQAAVLILNHGAARAKLWFYFETAMLESDDGELSAFPGRFFIDREQDYLHIIPTGDCGTHVVYRWSVIHAYVTKQCIVLPGGHRFFSEVIDRTPGILYMDLTDASGDCDLSPKLERRLDTGVRKQVDISFSVFLPKAWGSSNSAERVKLRVAADVWDKVRSRLMAMKEERMTPLAAREAVSDFTQQRIDVTAFIRLPLPKKYDEPELLAMAAHRYVALERVLMNLEKTLTTTYVQGQWELSSRNLAVLMVRAMWDTGASIAGAVLSLPGLIRTYGARMHNALFSDYVVEVTPAAEELMFVESAEETERVEGTRIATAVGYPGFSPEELRSVSARSEEFEDVRARALAVTRELAEAEAMVEAWADSGVYTGEAYHSVEREVKKDSHRELGKDREEVVQKMSTVVPDGMARYVSRVEDRPVCPSRQEMPDDDPEEPDPIGVLQEGFSRILPLCTSIDIERRPYVLSETDRIQNLDTMRFVTNRAKDVGPEEKLVMRPGIHTDVGGKRPVTQALTVSAVAKRVGGAPVYADPIVFEEKLREDFQKFEVFALKPGWRERTRAAVEGGLWDLDEHTIRSYAAKLSTSNVGKIIAEDFHAGNIDLTKWEIMVKSSLKPRMEESTFYADPAAQTIIYQKSKVTNSWFSMKLGKFHDFLDQELNDNVRINARRDEEDDEDWQTAVMQFYEPGDVNVECDITQCDKSQARYNLALYFYIIKQFGAPDWLMELWEVVIGKKTATATTVGLMVEFLNQILSGFWGTISANSLIVSVANVVCLGLTRENTRSLECKGDDTTVIMKKMVYTPVQVSERFNSMFNFEAKVETKDDIYNCSRFSVVVEGRAYRPKDPEKVISTLGRSLPWSANVEEQWESFRDSTRYYGNKMIMDALDEAYMRRTGRESLRGQLRAIGQLRRSFEAFKELKVHHTQWLS